MDEVRYSIDGKKYSLVGSRWYDHGGTLITDESLRKELFQKATWENRVPVGADLGEGDSSSVYWSDILGGFEDFNQNDVGGAITSTLIEWNKQFDTQSNKTSTLENKTVNSRDEGQTSLRDFTGALARFDDLSNMLNVLVSIGDNSFDVLALGDLWAYNERLVSLNRLNQVSQTIKQPLIYNINEMFDFPSEAEFIAELHKSGVEGIDDMVVVRADDTTAITQDLIITPELGFGPEYNKLVVHTEATDDGSGNYTYAQNVVKINAEIINPATKGTIVVPSALKSVNVFYFVGKQLSKQSYLIDTSNTYHTFSLTDTPLANVSNTATSTGTISVGGISFAKNAVSELSFGESYSTVTDIPNNFLRNFSSLLTLHIPFFTGVTTIGTYFCSSVPLLTTIDLSLITPNITSIDQYFLNGDSSLTSVNLSGLASNGPVTINGHYMCGNCSNLVELDIRGVNMTNLTVTGLTMPIRAFYGVSNENKRKLIASSTEDGLAFKSKFVNAISNWEIIVKA